jgi:hypothetical protein
MGITSRDAGQRAPFSLLLGAAMATSAGWPPAQGPAAPLAQPVKMHVRLYDYAHVPSKVLVTAEGQTGMIFRQAGVEVTWENSIPPKDPSQAKPTSPRPPDVASLDLRIVTHFESIPGALHYHSMGFAVPPDTATISLKWVEKLACLGVAEEYQVLGAAMAHEIGHLFLGPNSHSSVGIMRAGWKEDDLKQASQARLTFTTSEAEHIRLEVRRRQERQRTASGSAPTTTGSTPSSESVEPSLTIKVRVHNYTRAPRRVLAKAQKEGYRIFEHVGLQVLWVECPLSSRDLDTFPECREPLGLTGFDLNIVPHAMTDLLTISETTLGLTPMSAEGERGSVAYIFYDHVVTQAKVMLQFLPTILGYAIAHEIGHRLLRTTGHSPNGIMRAQWTPGDLRSAALGELLFTPEESELIRAELLARMSQQTVGSPRLDAVK